MPVLTLPNADTLSLSVRAKALVFEDPNSRELLARIRQVAPSGATCLITGETGTGKEIVARHIHDLSRRSTRAFVAVNCGALAEQLVESELFGHERGAFTGATDAKPGWFEAANGGTLFLDEIGDLSLPMQVKLLRVLQESEVVRIGSRQPIPIDVRLVAATNVDLEQAMEAGHFREDLFYRLNVVALKLPPLRERIGDIPALADYFLDVYRRRLGVTDIALSTEAVGRLLEHSWPGNIRELENAIHHAVLVADSNLIEPQHLQITTARTRAKAFPSQRDGSFGPTPHPAPVGPRSQEASGTLQTSLVELFDQGSPDLYQHIEEVVFRTAYEYCEKNQLQTGRLLGVSRNIVRERLIQFGLLQARARQNRDSEPPSPQNIAERATPSTPRLAYTLPEDFGQAD